MVRQNFYHDNNVMQEYTSWVSNIITNMVHHEKQIGMTS